MKKPKPPKRSPEFDAFADAVWGAADKLDSCIHTLRLPIADSTHVEALRGLLPEILQELRRALEKTGYEP